MADIYDLLGVGAPGGSVFNLTGGGSAPSAPVDTSPAPSPTFQKPHGIKAFLGMLGDAMLVAHGQAPMYQQRLQQEQENSALSGFLQNPDQAIQNLMQIDPKQGIALYSQVHPKSEVPEGLREFLYYQNMPADQRPQYEKFLQLTHPGMMAPVTLGPNDTVETPGASLPHVTDQTSYDAVPAGAKYTAPDGKVRQKPGGATASTPSPTFP